MSKRLMEFADRREWDLSGFTLDRLCFGYAMELRLGGAHHSLLTIIIEAPFTLRMGARAETMNPAHLLQMGTMLSLYGKPVTSLTAFRSGRLLVHFVDGSEVDVQKCEQYESWETFGEGEVADMNMLCSPHEGSPWGG